MEPSIDIRSEERLSIRASRAQKSVLRQAAEARHTSISQFVLEASISEAERILERERVTMVSGAEYAFMVALLDEPARDLPELASLVDQKPAWDV